MTDTHEDTDEESIEALAAMAVTPDYKVLGQLSDADGVGVLGQNDATTGTPKGVKGVVPNNADGYGLETPNDARIEGDLDTTGDHTVTVDGDRALRRDAESGTDAGSVVAGHSLNEVTAGAVGAAILGGGRDDNSAGVDHRHVVSDDYGTIAGGEENVAGDRDSDPTTASYATVGGGQFNKATASYATVGGGQSNNAEADNAMVAGGSNNRAIGHTSTVAGGYNNKARSTESAVGGGHSNSASGTHATIAGGYLNNTYAKNTTVAGGNRNEVTHRGGTAGGGERNDVEGQFSTVAGGGPADLTDVSNTKNRVLDNYGTIGGGGNNRAGDSQSGTTNATFATVAGGQANVAGDKHATVGGGEGNTAGGEDTTISGGTSNEATYFRATIGGGQGNYTEGDRATIAGGKNNYAFGYDSAIGGGEGNRTGVSGGTVNYYGTVPGGYNNVAAGESSFAAGNRAKAVDNGAFVWADKSGVAFRSDQDDSDGSKTSPTGSNTFHARATGGVRFVTSIDSNNDPDAGSYLTSGGSSWNSFSAARVKHDVRPVDPGDVLAGVESLEISRWAYDARPGVDRMGPMAGDFFDAFELGDDPETIGHIDADGVALAAIQGLAERLGEARERIREREDRIDDLEARLADLEATVRGDEGE